MAKKQIKLTVVTPEKQVLDEMVDDVVIPAHDGEMGVLFNRASLMCELGIGQMRFHRGGESARFFIDGGFAQVHQNAVSVLTTRAIRADEVTPAAINAEEAAANQASGRNAADVRQLARRRASAMRALRPQSSR